MYCRDRDRPKRRDDGLGTCQLKSLAETSDPFAGSRCSNSRFAGAQDNHLRILQIHRGYFQTVQDAIVACGFSSGIWVFAAGQQQTTLSQRIGSRRFVGAPLGLSFGLLLDSPGSKKKPCVPKASTLGRTTFFATLSNANRSKYFIGSLPLSCLMLGAISSASTAVFGRAIHHEKGASSFA